MIPKREVVKLRNEYVINSEIYNDLIIEFVVVNTKDVEIIFYKECDMLKLPSNKFYELNEALRNIAAGVKKSVDICLGQSTLRVESIANSKHSFSMMLFFNNNNEDIYRYDVDYLSFVGDRSISSSVVGFLENSSESELELLQEVISNSTVFRLNILSILIEVK